MKMNWQKIFALGVVLYLALALPMYYLNEEAVEKCRPACSKEGFDEVIGATHSSQGVQCRCFNTISTKERYVTVG